MIRHPDSNLQIAEKIELALSSQNKRVNTEGTNIVTNEFNREDYVINKAQTADKFDDQDDRLDSHELSLQSLQESKQNVLTAGDGINIDNNSVISVGWNWIKTKISSVLGLTSSAYDGKAATAGTADKVANAITFSNDGAGDTSGSIFDGSAARTLSYNSIGAAKDIYVVCPCSAATVAIDNQNQVRISAESTIDELINNAHYVIEFNTTSINNTSSTGNIFLNINSLGDKALYWGSSNGGQRITRQFSLPQGIYTAVYKANNDSFYLYFPASFFGIAFQRFGQSYVTCFGNANVDGWYIATRFNPLNTKVTLAFTGVDGSGYGYVTNVTVVNWTNPDCTVLMYYNHTDKTLTALSI